MARAEYTSQIAVASSALVFNRATNLFGGTVALTNQGASAIAGPLLASFAGLGPTVILQGAAPVQGLPSLLVANGLAPGATLVFPVSFANPSRGAITYGVRIFDGH